MSEELQTCIQAISDGNLQEAKLLLVKFVRNHSASQEGWYLLGTVMDIAEQQRYCYMRVLSLNPKNQIAWQALAQIHQPKQFNIPAVQSSPKAVINFSQIKSRFKISLVSLRQYDWKKLWPSLVFGFLVSLLLFTLPAWVFIQAGMIDEYLINNNMINAPTMAPFYDEQVAPGTPVNLNTPTPLPEYVGSYEERWEQAETLLPMVETYINADQCDEALPLLDQMVAMVPEYAEFYFKRAYCSYQMIGHFDMYKYDQQYAYDTLTDLNEALTLQPDNGKYYALRGMVYWQLANLRDLTIDQQALCNIAVDNLQAGKDLGYYEEGYYLAALTASGHNEEALAALQNYLETEKPTDNNYTYTQITLAKLYAGMGDLDTALDTLYSISDYSKYVANFKMLEAKILYQQGKADEALLVLKNFSEKPTNYKGQADYLEALIQYEKGIKDEAAITLDHGRQATWFEGGIYSYVQGLISLDKGTPEDIASGIQALQYAEASLDPSYEILRQRIQLELNELGASAMAPTVSIENPTTLPDFQAQPTARATLTATPIVSPSTTPTLMADTEITTETTPLDTPTQTLTPQPKIYLPNDYITVVDMETGLQSLNINLGDRTILRFQPAYALALTQVESLKLTLETADEDTPLPIVELWNPKLANWTSIPVCWGECNITYPGDYVTTEGDVYIAFRSQSSQLTIDHVILHLVYIDSFGNRIAAGKP